MVYELSILDSSPEIVAGVSYNICNRTYKHQSILSVIAQVEKVMDSKVYSEDIWLDADGAVWVH
jgi:hypothetical protein